MAKKRKFIAIGAIALVITLMGTLTYAFFVVNVGETKNETVQLTAGTMALTFSDNSDGINQALMFGESVTKDFKIENTGTLDAVAKISFNDLVNTYLAESLTYILSYATSETEEYQVVKTGNVPRSETVSKIELADGLVVPDGETYYYRLVITLENLENIDQTSDTSARLSTRFKMEEGRSTYAVTVSGLKLNVNKTTPDFAEVATTDEGVYAMADDYGASYYFRGSVENNYVKFGKWAEGTDYAGSDMYWRIIRVNGDGSVRMIYDGTSAHANGEVSEDRSAFQTAWNETNYNDAKYVGYMYGGANGIASTAKTEADCDSQTDCIAAQKNETDTNIKTELESWYKTNLKDNYGQYIADAIFCNDRSTASTSGSWSTSDTTLGYGTNPTYYGAFDRFVTNSSTPTPTFVCPTNSTLSSNNDWFTADATTANKGNGKLDQPVGLITADEIVAAGGKWATVNQGYYLYKGHYYWTLSPNVMHTNGYAFVFYVNIYGTLGNMGVNGAGAVAPVINLTPEYAKTMIGTGTLVDPYRAESTN